MCSTTNSRLKNQTNTKNTVEKNGFTVVEIAIVMIILGALIAASTSAYMQYLQWKRSDITQQNIEDVQQEIGAFLQIHGRYPCPASLEAYRDEDDIAYYGTEPFDRNCSDTSDPTAAGVDLNGNDRAEDFFVVSSVASRNITYKDPATGNDITGVPRVRIGAVPFRTLGLREDQAYDGYGNRIMYAVTEHLAVQQSFEGNTGGISLVKPDQENLGSTIDLTAETGAVHFLLFSYGENGAGAYSEDGIRSSCPTAASVENENCDLTADATFQIIPHSKSSDTEHFDDFIAYGRTDTPLWFASEDDDYGVVEVKVEGNIGVGPGASENPQEKIDVAGTLRAFDNPDTAEIQEGQVKAHMFCSHGNDETCAITSAISGDLEEKTGGIECAGDNEFILGIEENGPRCGIVEARCADGQYLIGINSDGTLNCGDALLPGCPRQSVGACQETHELPPTPHGQSYDIRNAGDSYNVRYDCNAGTWEFSNEWGHCNPCIGTEGNIEYTSCTKEGSICGDGYSGQHMVQLYYACPDREWKQLQIANKNFCKCEETFDVEATTCFHPLVSQEKGVPSGSWFNRGSAQLISFHDCGSDTPSCTDYQYHKDDCHCEEVLNSPAGTEACHSKFPGFAGTIRKYKDFTCPNGKYQPGTTAEIREDTSECTCQVTDEPVPAASLDCSQIKEGTVGTIKRQKTISIVNGSCVSDIENVPGPEGDPDQACQPPPPITCSWNAIGSAFGDGIAGRRDGDPCDCAMDTSSIQNCSRGNSLFNCECRVD